MPVVSGVMYFLVYRNELVFHCTVEPLSADTSARRIPLYKDNNVQSQIGRFHSFDLCDQDNSQIRTAVVSPKGFLNREIPL
jgi:hypothetical protein